MSDFFVFVTFSAALSRASPCFKATEGDRFCGNVFALTLKILGDGVLDVAVVVVFVGFVGVVEFRCLLAGVRAEEEDAAVEEAFVLATVIRFCSELCCDTVDAGTDNMFVRERDFIILMGVDVLVCMRLISESSSSSYSLQFRVEFTNREEFELSIVLFGVCFVFV